MKTPFRQTLFYRVPLGILLMGAASATSVWLYSDITRYENGESGLVLNTLSMMAYDLTGKWGTLTLWAGVCALGIFFLCSKQTEDD